MQTILDICESTDACTSDLDFRQPCQYIGPTALALKKAAERPRDWASRGGAFFAPRKYQWIQLARNPNKTNMNATIYVIAITFQPSPDICILGVRIIDTRLKWHARVREVRRKSPIRPLPLPKSLPLLGLPPSPGHCTYTLR